MPIELDNVRSGFNLQVINDNFQKIEDEWDEKLDRRVSTQGNQMEQDLDMNGFNLLNAEVNGVRLDDAIGDTRTLRDETEVFRDQAEEFKDQSEASSLTSQQFSVQSGVSATSASASAAAASATVDTISSITTAPVLLWVDGEQSTVGGQRYLFGDVLYVAIQASPTNPITLGATPVGDPNWTDWSVPIASFVNEGVLTSPSQTFDVGAAFFEVQDVYLGGLIQEEGSFTANPSTGIITFNEMLPTGTHVKVWVGRRRDTVVTEFENLITTATGTVTDYASGVLASATDILRPGQAFTSAEISADGVTQQPGAGKAYIVEADSVNPAFNQIRFSSQLPIGTEVFGILRNR